MAHQKAFALLSAVCFLVWLAIAAGLYFGAGAGNVLSIAGATAVAVVARVFWPQPKP